MQAGNTLFSHFLLTHSVKFMLLTFDDSWLVSHNSLLLSYIIENPNPAWWYTPIVPALEGTEARSSEVLGQLEPDKEILFQEEERK